MSKMKTKEEIREEFVSYIWDTMEEIETQKHLTSRQKLEELTVAILSIIDGCSFDLPNYILAPLTFHETNRILMEQGQDYYPVNGEVEGDIAGELHELFQQIRQKITLVS